MIDTTQPVQPPREITDKILRQENYIATVHVWFPFQLPDTLVQEILNTCLIPEKSKYFDTVQRPTWNNIHSRPYFMQGNPWYIAKLTLQYPTDDTFRLLETLESDYSDFLACNRDGVLLPNVRITRVDIAKDLICDLEYDADEVILYLNSHLFKKYPGKQQVHLESGNTRYTGQSAAANIITTYAKYDCPVHDQPCAHIEWRATNHAAVKRLGIHSAGDLVNFNSREIWKSRFTLRTIDNKTKIRIGKIMLDETGDCKNRYHQYSCNDHVLPAFNMYLKYGNQFTRSGINSLHHGHHNEAGKYTYLDVQFVMNRLKAMYGNRRGKNINEYFPNVDCSEFL